jgi:hypothetical protein
MRPIPINIAVEDLLSEAVAKRLLADSGRSFSIGVVYNHGGNGYLRTLLSGYFSEESRNVLRISMMLRFFPGTI